MVSFVTGRPVSCFERVTAGIEPIHFARAAALEPGERNSGRLHAPQRDRDDDTRNEANHIRSSWHGLERNFGRDLLREHDGSSRRAHACTAPSGGRPLAELDLEGPLRP